MARRSLKAELNQIRAWVREGRTDAWIAHQLEVSVSELRAFKREHGLTGPERSPLGGDLPYPDEDDLRARDEELVAERLRREEEERLRREEEERMRKEAEQTASVEQSQESADSEAQKRRRKRRGRRGGRRRRGQRHVFEATFDHGEEGYGIWLDPAVQDDPLYAEHWAGHRPVKVTIEADRLIVTRLAPGELIIHDDEADGESAESAHEQAPEVGGSSPEAVAELGAADAPATETGEEGAPAAESRGEEAPSAAAETRGDDESAPETRGDEAPADSDEHAHPLDNADEQAEPS